MPRLGRSAALMSAPVSVVTRLRPPRLLMYLSRSAPSTRSSELSAGTAIVAPRDGDPHLRLTLLDPGVLHQHPNPLSGGGQAGFVSSGQLRQELLTAPPHRDVTAPQSVDS